MSPRHFGRQLAICLSTMVLLGACASSPLSSASSPAANISTTVPTATFSPSTVETTPVVTPAPSSVSASPSAGDAGATEPSILDVTCTPSGTVIGSSRVAAQRDGVHLRIRNTSGTSRSFDIDGVGGGDAPDTEGMQVWALPIGDARVWCGPSAAKVSDWISIEVVDPAGFYVRDQLDCSAGASATLDYAQGARGAKGDPVAVARRQITGLRAGDVVERAGYIGSDEPEVRVIRGGMVVAVGTYVSDGAGGWLITNTTSCSRSGLGWRT